MEANMYKTTGEAKDALIANATKFIGYIEKASNKDLNGFTDNIGNKNFTWFAKYLTDNGVNCPNGYAWCDTFCDALMLKTFGKELASKMIGGFSFYTVDSATKFKKMGRLIENKSEITRGDQIFFEAIPAGEKSKRICHTGFVISVVDGIIYTIEGNTSGGVKFEREGGRVAMKSYKVTSTYIKCAGRPDYSLAVVK
ncbi:MAG: CHAP domain-containing protein [Fusobacteriaceae bacterium]|jgi:hypothetical protein|nr:CHAP domain-containing protein [Fusobacteriaceae bacterium]